MKEKTGFIYQKMKKCVDFILVFVRAFCAIFLQFPYVGMLMILAIMMLIFKEEITAVVFEFYEKWCNGV